MTDELYPHTLLGFRTLARHPRHFGCADETEKAMKAVIRAIQIAEGRSTPTPAWRTVMTIRQTSEKEVTTLLAADPINREVERPISLKDRLAARRLNEALAATRREST